MKFGLISVVVALVALLAACSSPPEVPVGPNGERDQVLVTGQGVYSARCQSCHGARGGGGRGPNITSVNMLAKYPNIDEQILVVANGRDQMPRFSGQLSDAEIDAVVRYTREVLGV